MCGFVTSIPAVNAHKFDRALRTLTHRGPDGGNSWSDGVCMLGHRRLSILDTSSAADQPMHHKSGRYHLVFNGEIYNFVELREELVVLGEQFVTDSDSEVLLSAFRAWGEGCLEKINGMFAFAIWDEDEKTLFVARDPLGEKPLFYQQCGDQIYFASEQKALLELMTKVEISADFHRLVRDPYGYEGTDASLIKGVKRFPAGHFGIFSAQRKLTITRYWRLGSCEIEVASTYGGQVEQLRSLLIDSCKLRIRSDVPVGTALSGGVDSSAVAASMCCAAELKAYRQAHKWQSGFVASFPGSVMDEVKPAAQIADHLGIELHVVNTDLQQNLPARLDQAAYLFEEVHEVNPLPHISLYAAMRRRNVLVSIDGHGGDELFCGYESSILHALLGAGLRFNTMKNIIDTYRSVHPDDPTFRGLNNAQIVFYIVKQKLKSIKMATGLSDSERQEFLRLGELERHLYGLSFKTVLPTLLRNYDRYSMMNGVEIRIPLLDPRIVSFAFSLDWRSKLNSGYTKAVLRDAVAPFLPQDIIKNKRKLGFAPPLVSWIKEDLKEYLLDEFSSQSFKQCELIDSNALRLSFLSIMNSSSNDGLYETEKLWKSFSIYLWYKNFYGFRRWG